MTFFKTPSEFNAWLKKHHSSKTELIVGFYKKDSGKESITWQESVDEALCFGWIDGIRKRVDDERYTIRFTPRRLKSNWSEININRAAELQQQGRMQKAGLLIFEQRDESKTKQYSYEMLHKGLDPTFEKRLKTNKKAWTFFQSQAPSYQKTAGFWVMSAKQEVTREKRFLILLQDSEKGLRILPLRYGTKK